MFDLLLFLTDHRNIESEALIEAVVTFRALTYRNKRRTLAEVNTANERAPLSGT